MFVIVPGIEIIAPLGHVSVHIEKPPLIGALTTNKMRFAGRVFSEPGISLEFPRIVTKAVLRVRAPSTGILPLSLGGKPVAVCIEVALPTFFVVARLKALRE